MLVDTSVWIDFFNGKKNFQSELLKNLLVEEEIIFITPTIIQEILQGIRDDEQYLKVKDSITSLEILNIDSVDASIGAADLYRELRKKGITIKKSNDCLIAFHALYFNIEMLHKDSDFDLIAKQTKLKVVKN